jgi:hypothetical protein
MVLAIEILGLWLVAMFVICVVLDIWGGEE